MSEITNDMLYEALAAWDETYEGEWVRESNPLVAMRAALTAAYPFIREAALDEAAASVRTTNRGSLDGIADDILALKDKP